MRNSPQTGLVFFITQKLHVRRADGDNKTLLDITRYHGTADILTNRKKNGNLYFLILFNPTL